MRRIMLVLMVVLMLVATSAVPASAQSFPETGEPGQVLAPLSEALGLPLGSGEQCIQAIDQSIGDDDEDDDDDGDEDEFDDEDNGQVALQVPGRGGCIQSIQQ